MKTKRKVSRMCLQKKMPLMSKKKMKSQPVDHLKVQDHRNKQAKNSKSNRIKMVKILNLSKARAKFLSSNQRIKKTLKKIKLKIHHFLLPI